LDSGHLQTLTSYASGTDFLLAKRREYAHQPERYTTYFDFSKEDEIATFPYFQTVSSGATAALACQLRDWTQEWSGPAAEAPTDARGPLTSAILTSLEGRDDRAVTRALFQPELASRNVGPAASRVLARMISVGYTRHYQQVMFGVCPTGLPQLTYYDPFAESFPFLDYPLLQRILQLLGLPIPGGSEITALLAVRSAPAHVHFVQSMRQLLAACHVEWGEMPARRASTAARLAHISRHLVGQKKRKTGGTASTAEWPERLLAAAEIAHTLSGGAQGEITILRVAGKSVRKYTLRLYSFFFKEIEAKSAAFSTPS
jgi:hypothetical protein